jgi:hypothetical protein
MGKRMSKKCVMWIAGAIMAIFLGVPMTLSLGKAQRIAAFESRLSIGRTPDGIKKLAAASGVKIGSFNGQPKNIMFVQISDTWRFGTPCDDVVYEKLVFENGHLQRWATEDTDSCM